jgi:predicted DNA-binding transcriptional regulator AlpA
VAGSAGETDMSDCTAIKLLTNAQTAELMGLRPSTLEIWRLQGKGPPYRKIGRLVRYSEAEVLAWIDDQIYTSTSQRAD